MDDSRGFRRLIFRTRGVWLLAAILPMLWLKHVLHAAPPPRLWYFLLLAALAAQCFRTWAAGFVGTVARGQEAQAETLLTAGPYAHVRNPMYLGNLVIVGALAGLSGLWYAPLLAWLAFAFVYANVIPYEESYLTQAFGEEYREYCRAVP